MGSHHQGEEHHSRIPPAGCYSAQAVRSGHSGEEEDTCPEVPRLFMLFILYSQLITNPTTPSEQEVPLATKTRPGALVLSRGRVNLEFLAAERPSVKVVVTQPAVLACQQKPAYV